MFIFYFKVDLPTTQKQLSDFGFRVGQIKSDAEITEDICNIINRDLQPFFYIDQDGFCTFVRRAYPYYTMVSRATITKRIENMYKAQKQVNISIHLIVLNSLNLYIVLLKQALKDKLKDVTHVAIGTDSLTCKYKNKSFVTYTCNYYNSSNCSLNSSVLETVPFG